jgi:hypothetical protein
MEQKLEEALMIELQRQADDSDLTLTVKDGGIVHLTGHLDVTALAAAMVGSVAGGP